MDDFKGGYTAFSGHQLLARGKLEEVVAAAKERVDLGATERLAIYENETGRVLDFDFRGTLPDVLHGLTRHPIVGAGPREPKEKKGPGRPRLGVVSREVTLLPRHWEWLGLQRGGASATLRRLVEDARRRGQPGAAAKRAQEATYRFLADMAADLPDFEEVSRAFFAGDYASVSRRTEGWPEAIRKHLQAMLDLQTTEEAGE